mmetsp:Transcript_12685/g.38358  ORF Transcript_12685/g.38358 Transcript_12685/m.38358 type:complete len:242 (+) Transcript_12685:600-1325(+)
MCCATSRSCSSLRPPPARLLSRRRSTTSKRERRGEGRPVLTEIERSWSYPLPFGLHAAKTEHFVRSLQTRPAFATDSVCCSIASWIAPRSCSRIESNSSIAHTPPSASTSAPASSIHSPPGSRIAVQVSPADVAPMPVVRTERGERRAAWRSSADLPVPASPTSSRCDSPRTRMLLASVCETPPMRVRRRPSLTRYMPASDGHAIATISSRALRGMPASRLARHHASNSAPSSLETRAEPT